MGKCADWGCELSLITEFLRKCFYIILDMRYNVCKRKSIYIVLIKITTFYVHVFLNGKEKIIQSTADINDIIIALQQNTISSIFKITPELC